MFDGMDLGSASRARHADMLREAEEWRLFQRAATRKESAWSRWSSALLIWLGKQLIGWGKQLERPA